MDFLTILFIIIYRAYGSGKEDSPLCDVPGFENCRMKLLRHVSFVDCPVCSKISLINSLSHVYLGFRFMDSDHLCRFRKWPVANQLKVCIARRDRRWPSTQ
jgi:hypothetical protein